MFPRGTTILSSSASRVVPGFFVGIPKPTSGRIGTDDEFYERLAACDIAFERRAVAMKIAGKIFSRTYEEALGTLRYRKITLRHFDEQA